jgi:hypothetical protein
VETLDHRALLAAGKFHQPAGIRAGDSQRVDHFILVESQKTPCRYGSAEGSSQSGRMEAAFFKRIASSDADATHNFTGRHKGGQESFPVRPLHFTRSERGEKCSCAGVNAGAGLTDVVNSKACAIVPLANAARCAGTRRFSPNEWKRPRDPGL